MVFSMNEKERMAEFRRIKLGLPRLGISLYRFLKIARIDYSLAWKWDRGQHVPSLTTVERMGRVFQQLEQGKGKSHAKTRNY
jgi:hypothetical protein